MSIPASAPHGTTGQRVPSVGKMPDRAKVMTARTPTTSPDRTAVGIALSASTMPCQVVTCRRMAGAAPIASRVSRSGRMSEADRATTSATVAPAATIAMIAAT